MTVYKPYLNSGYYKNGKEIPFRYLTPEQQRLRILGFPGAETGIPVDPSQVTATNFIRPAVLLNGEPVSIVRTTNANGETVELAIDEDGEVIGAKKVPPNIMPIALAAAAAWLFLM